MPIYGIKWLKMYISGHTGLFKMVGLTKVGLLVCNRSYSLSLLLVLLLLASVWVVTLDVGNILRHGMACGKDSQDYGEDGLIKKMCNFLVCTNNQEKYLLTNFMVTFLKVMLRLIRALLFIVMVQVMVRTAWCTLNSVAPFRHFL